MLYWTFFEGKTLFYCGTFLYLLPNILALALTYSLWILTLVLTSPPFRTWHFTVHKIIKNLRIKTEACHCRNRYNGGICPVYELEILMYNVHCTTTAGHNNNTSTVASAPTVAGLMFLLIYIQFFWHSASFSLLTTVYSFRSQVLIPLRPQNKVHFKFSYL